MKMLFYGFVVMMCFGQWMCYEICTTESSGCGENAIVKDLSDLDGCDIGLELTDGTILIPERRVYVQAPKPEEDPAYYFEFVPGDEVCIAYNEVELVTACMAGKTVFLTCIKKISNTSQGD